MSHPRSLRFLLPLCLVALLVGADAAAADLLVEGDFEACPKGAALRRDDKGQDWYESRRDGDDEVVVFIAQNKPVSAVQFAALMGGG